MGALIAVSLFMYMVLDNKRRDKKAGRKIGISDVRTELLREGPFAPEYR